MICAYSIEDIDQAFSTSKLKGYSSPFIGSRPGMVRKSSVFFLTVSRFWQQQKKVQMYESAYNLETKSYSSAIFWKGMGL